VVGAVELNESSGELTLGVGNGWMVIQILRVERRVTQLPIDERANLVLRNSCHGNAVRDEEALQSERNTTGVANQAFVRGDESR
jgi:hypothetical protein